MRICRNPTLFVSRIPSYLGNELSLLYPRDNAPKTYKSRINIIVRLAPSLSLSGYPQKAGTARYMGSARTDLYHRQSSNCLETQRKSLFICSVFVYLYAILCIWPWLVNTLQFNNVGIMNIHIIMTFARLLALMGRQTNVSRSDRKANIAFLELRHRDILVFFENLW